jgi:ATP/maltotriose-dependent transcriptional regulator MalT
VPEWAVQRPRITKLITEGARWCPLTVVAGPPGAGKTMALALWTAAGPGTVAWVRLDGHDNRPEVFWSYVVAALRRSGAPFRKALPSAGQLAEIRSGDLAFSTGEAGLLLARHGRTLTADVLASLMRRTGGWAAGLRLAALWLGTHPDPGRVVRPRSREIVNMPDSCGSGPRSPARVSDDRRR